MTKYLEQNFDNLNISEWEDLILKFLILISQSADDALIESMVQTEMQRIHLYTKPPEKCLLIKCLAISSSYLKDKKLIATVLDTVIDVARKAEGRELTACCEAIGICSRTQLKTVLKKLLDIRNEFLAKKSGKIFQLRFLNGQKDHAELEKVLFMVFIYNPKPHIVTFRYGL